MPFKSPFQGRFSSDILTRKVDDTFVALRSITFKMELLAMQCQSIVDNLLNPTWVLR